MKPGLEILAAGAAGGGVGALGGYGWARLRGDLEHRWTNAVAWFILLGTLSYVVAAFVVG